MAGNGWTNPGALNARGFSLLEAFIALTVLLVGIAGVAASFQAHISNSVAARNQAQAAIIAQSVLTELSDSDPREWNTESLKEAYFYDFDGNNVALETDAYYVVDLGTPVNQGGWWDVSIGITWAGWKSEQDKSGFGNTNESFAYVLETSIAPFIPDQVEE